MEVSQGLQSPRELASLNGWENLDRDPPDKAGMNWDLEADSTDSAWDEVWDDLDVPGSL
jgi:hypothetical protein